MSNLVWSHVWSQASELCSRCGLRWSVVQAYPGGIPCKGIESILPDNVKTIAGFCECGSAALGSDRHSAYCPLYRKD